MKKLALLLCGLLLLPTLLACGSGGNGTTAPEGVTSGTPITDAPITDTPTTVAPTVTDAPTESAPPTSKEESPTMNDQTTTPTPPADPTPYGLRAMSFNIRCAEFTEERIDLVIRMIETYDPDTIGFQEATVEWMDVLRERIGEKYADVGVGRNADFSGEASPVFFKRETFELVESGTRWMCDTPDTPGSKIPESSLPRVYSYALLRIKETGGQFLHINTHLEHTTEDAREIQIVHLLDFLREYCNDEIPYVLTGDFNTTEDTQTYRAVTRFGLSDSAKIATEALTGTTYHGYGKTSTIIDYIFIPEWLVSVDRYQVCTETFEDAQGNIAYPSDHNPIFADILLWE